MIIFVVVAAIFLFLIVNSYLRRRGISQYGPEQADELRRNHAGDVILLDVRTDAERAAGSIPGSLHIPLQELRQRIAELKKYGNREIICFCQSGNRSGTAAHLLRKQGLKSANMKGGIAEWNFLHRTETRQKGKR